MVRIELTFDQWGILSDIIGEKRDSWARIVADAVVEGRTRGAVDSYAKKYAELDSVLKALMDSEAEPWTN